MWFGFEASRKTCSALKHAQQGLTMMQHVHQAFNHPSDHQRCLVKTLNKLVLQFNEKSGWGRTSSLYAPCYILWHSTWFIPASNPPKSLIEATEEHFCQSYLWWCTTHHFPGAILALSLTVESHCISEGWCLNFFLIWQTWNWRISSCQWTFNW